MIIIQDVARKNTGQIIDADVTQLMTIMKTDADKVRNVNLQPGEDGTVNAITFTCPSYCARWINKFCQTSSSEKSQLGIDTTYNVGRFYTTTFTFKHPMLLGVRTGLNPTIIGGIMTSVTRTKNDYRFMAEEIKKSANLESLIYGTDGEIALVTAMEETFPSDTSIHLRCFDHLKNNFMSKLEKLSVPVERRNKTVTEILEIEEGETRRNGLVDTDFENFDAVFEELKISWPDDFVSYLENCWYGGRSVKEILSEYVAQCAKKAWLGKPPPPPQQV